MLTPCLGRAKGYSTWHHMEGWSSVHSSEGNYMKLQYFTNLKTLAGDDSHHDSSHSEVTIIGHYNLTRFQGT